MKKKLIAIFCAILMTCSLTALTACGGGGSGGSGGGGNDGADWWTTTGELTMNGDEVVFNDVQIKFTTVVTGEDKETLQSLIYDFNELYRGKINIIPEYRYQDGFEASVAQNISQNHNAPDLIMSHQKGHKSFAQQKLIQPFDEAMEKSGIVIDINNYADILSQYSSLGYDGKVFGVPIDAQSEVVFYNKKLLAKYNAQLPQNRSELLALCEIAKNDGKTAIAIDGDGSFYQDYWFTTAVMQNGGQLYNKDTYKADWYSNAENRAAFTAGIDAIREMNTKNYSKYGASVSEALTAFLSDDALFYVAQPWEMSDILNTYASRHKSTVDEIIENDIGGTSIANWFACDSSAAYANKIFADSHFFAMSNTVTDINKKVAMLVFIKWFTETGSVGARWAEAGHMSVSQKIVNSTEYKNNKYVTNFINKFYPDINQIECFGATPYYQDTNEQLSSICANTIGVNSVTSYDTVLQSTENTLNGIVDFF